MSLESCTEHDGVVVVYDPRGNNRYPCPLCQVVEQKENLEKEVEQLTDRASQAEDELSSEQRTASDLRSELSEAQDRISELERIAEETSYGEDF